METIIKQNKNNKILQLKESFKINKMVNNKMKTYNIDWEFIASLEGNELQGYVPSNNSGVTIASGVDLKEKTVAFLNT